MNSEFCAIWINGVGRIAEGDYFIARGRTYRVWKCVSGCPNKFLTTSGKLIPACEEIKKAEPVNVNKFDTLVTLVECVMAFQRANKVQERRAQVSLHLFRVWAKKHKFSYLKLQRLTDMGKQNN